jgi:hypothetical protein
VTFGAKGGGNANCSSLVYGGSWDFVMDGCQVFGASGTQSLPPQGSGACPPANDPNFPGRTKKILQDFFPPNIDLTGVTACNPVTSALSDATTVCINMPSASFPGTSFTCDPNWNGATSGATAGAKKLIAGFTYYYSTINLNSGCTIDTNTINGGNSTTNGDWVSGHPTRLYALVINISTGTKGLINQPPTATFPNICSSAARPTTNPSTWSYNDISSPQNPSSYYCSGWAKSLQLNILDSATSSSTISGNGGKFWGTWLGPKGAITLNSPQMEFWGAMMSGNVSVKNQFSWHYDDSLSSIRSTRYSVNNWREEPLG